MNEQRLLCVTDVIPHATLNTLAKCLLPHTKRNLNLLQAPPHPLCPRCPRPCPPLPRMWAVEKGEMHIPDPHIKTQSPQTLLGGALPTAAGKLFREEHYLGLLCRGVSLDFLNLTQTNAQLCAWSRPIWPI